MAFADIPGNEKIKAILRSVLRRKRAEDRLVILPTLLFAGAEGAGQRETALELAKALNCETAGDDACGACDSCRKIDAGLHPDVIDIKKLPRKKDKDETRSDKEKAADEDDESPHLTGRAETELIPDKFYMDQVREAIKLAYLKPMIGRKRLFLIDDASKMEPPAANALLKILEEPPDFTQFILIASNVDLLLPTIVSRCQVLSFAPIPFEDIAALLRGRGFDEAGARTAARLTGGNYRQALVMKWEDVRARRDRAWELFRLILAGPVPTDFLRIFGSTGRASRKKDGGDVLEWPDMLEHFSAFARDLLLIAETGGTSGLFNPDFEAGLRELAPAVGRDRALSLVRTIDTAIAAVDDNLNRRLQASVLFARMTG